MADEVQWVDLGLPCPLCRLDTVAHLHGKLPDGSYSIVVMSKHAEEAIVGQTRKST